MTLRLALSAFCLLAAALAADWPDYRGPNRDGRSAETNLPSQWSPAGENLAWKAPYGGRSTPVIHGNHLYLMNTVGKGAGLQERVLCLDAATGKPIWEHRMTVYASDVPPHRAAWAAPAVDPETGNVYAHGVGGHLVGLSRAGKLLWERSLAEEVGSITTHGGRTVSPVVDGNLVIVSTVTSGWSEQARAAHRFFALDKRTGQFVWAGTPGGRPYDTTYAPPTIATVNGQRLFITGGGDGAVHAIQPQTGVPVWKFEMSKRGVNTGVLVQNGMAIVTHSEENIDSNEMGLLAAIDATQRGPLTAAHVKWRIQGFQGGYSNPILDGDRIFQIDNGANLHAFDFVTGRQLWKQNLGTIQKASPVLAGGRIYVGTENGRFFILKPHSDRCEILSSVALGTEQQPEAILASPAIAHGRVYVVSVDNIYAIGPRTPAPAAPAGVKPTPDPAPAGAKPAHLQVSPTELILKPGGSVRFTLRLYDDKGRFIREAPSAEWSLDKLKGRIEAGQFTAAADNIAQAGSVKATVDGVAGAARVRVLPPLPWSEDFESLAPNTVPAHWINTAGKYAVREMGGGKVLAKLADNAFTKRARSYMGPPDWHGYTVECDVSAMEKRRQMGDAGIVAQRYQLTLFGNHQRLELQSWQPETQRTVLKEFPWKKDAWYRLKLRVENLPDGKVKAQGKAWPVGEPEPAQWTLERIDPVPNRSGSPGIYADAPFEVYFDNFKVTWN